MKKAAKAPQKKTAEAKKKAQWYRAMAMAMLTESDIYCVCDAIECASPEGRIVTDSWEEAHPADWDTLPEHRKKKFEPKRAIVSRLLVQLTIPVSMLEPLGKQTAAQLRTIAKQLESAADDVEGFEDYRNMAMMKDLAAGRLNARLVEGYGVEVFDRAGKIVPIIERDDQEGSAA